MAGTLGLFSENLRLEAWFDDQKVIEGWFDEDLINAAATGNAVFVGTVPVVFGQTGALLASTALTGTGTVTFSQSGSLNARSALTGTATLTFSQTGALRGNAAFAGTIPTLFGQSGTLLAGSTLAGTATTVFSQSGAASASASFAGTATIVFGATADFVAAPPVGDAVFDGVATITFSASADFSVGSTERQGGGWLSKEQLRDYEKGRKRRKSAIDDLERTIEAFFEEPLPSIDPPPPNAQPQALVTKAREISRALVAQKHQNIITAENAKLLKELKRYADAVIADMHRLQREEEEAIVMLLAA